jgi:hypothetical protein
VTIALDDAVVKLTWLIGVVAGTDLTMDSTTDSDLKVSR